MRTTLIIHLSASPNPAAVVWRVALFIVFAFNAISWRGLTHIAKKVFKRPPAITDGNSAPTVILKVWMVRIRTSLSHSDPSDVLFGAAQTMFRHGFDRDFSRPASAAFRSLDLYRSQYRYDDFSAIAPKLPLPLPVLVASCDANCNKTVKPSASDVSNPALAFLRNGIGVIVGFIHGVNLRSRFALWLGSFGCAITRSSRFYFNMDLEA